MKINHSYIGMITAIASLGGLLFGFDMAVISGILPFVQEQFSLSAIEEGWFVSSALVGCIAGVGVSGELSDRFGRKRLLILSAGLFLLSALGSAVMPTFSLLILARILGGVGVGIASNIVPLYISEVAPAQLRGRLVTCYQLGITLGILVAYLSNAGLLQYSVAQQQDAGQGVIGFLFVNEVWRGMFSIEILPALLFLMGLLKVPESPRWLIQKGREKEGEAILGKIKVPAEARQDVKDIQAGLSSEKGSYRELLAPGMRRALLIGLLLPLFSQFSGINAIIYYGPSILNDAGLNLSSSLFSQIILGSANMLFTLVAVWKVDTLGRRPLYISGALCATISLIFTGLCFYTGNTKSILLLLSALAFLASFAFSIGPLKFVIASEIFPNKIRGRALALSIMVMWLADTIVGLITPILLDSIGVAATFWFFAFFCLVALIVVYKLVPETKGKSLEEIQGMWNRVEQNELTTEGVAGEKRPLQKVKSVKSR